MSDMGEMYRAWNKRKAEEKQGLFHCVECGILLADVTNEADAICGRCVDKCLQEEMEAGANCEAFIRDNEDWLRKHDELN